MEMLPITIRLNIFDVKTNCLVFKFSRNLKILKDKKGLGGRKMRVGGVKGALSRAGFRSQWHCGVFWAREYLREIETIYEYTSAYKEGGQLGFNLDKNGGKISWHCPFKDSFYGAAVLLPVQEPVHGEDDGDGLRG